MIGLDELNASIVAIAVVDMYKGLVGALSGNWPMLHTIFNSLILIYHSVKFYEEQQHWSKYTDQWPDTISFGTSDIKRTYMNVCVHFFFSLLHICVLNPFFLNSLFQFRLETLFQFKFSIGCRLNGKHLPTEKKKC